MLGTIKKILNPSPNPNTNTKYMHILPGQPIWTLDVHV